MKKWFINFFYIYTFHSEKIALIDRRTTPLQRRERLVQRDDVHGDLGQRACEEVVVDGRVVGRGLDRVVRDDVARRFSPC